jgi:hypothetical protein
MDTWGWSNFMPRQIDIRSQIVEVQASEVSEITLKRWIVFVWVGVAREYFHRAILPSSILVDANTNIK